MIEITTPRLTLRTCRPSDLDGLHAVLSDPRAMAYWSTEPHATLAITRDWLDCMLAIRPEEGEDFIIEYRGRVIGKAGFYRFPEIGYVLHPDVWGQGIGTEMLRPILHRAFAVHGLASVLADVDPRNKASLALLTRLGFRETGRAEKTFEIAGQWVDSVYLTLDSADFPTPHSPKSSIAEGSE